MEDCLQTDSQNVLEHGQLVWQFTKKLISGQFDGMKIPDWFSQNHRYIVNNLHDVNDIKLYNIYHDCGKPYCLEVDNQGKRHFPNHAEVSKETWQSLSDNQIVADLIGYDMCLHVDTADQIKAYNWNKKTAFTLLVTALAEIHANASMFGGIESISFKMKWKKLNKRGKMLLKLFPESEEHPYSYVIVRKDLPSVYQTVQGTHAAIEQFRASEINYHPSVIYVVVKDEKKLKKVANDLLDQGINFSIFKDPMPEIGDEMTAICTEPLEGEKREFMKKFQLLL